MSANIKNGGYEKERRRGKKRTKPSRGLRMNQTLRWQDDADEQWVFLFGTVNMSCWEDGKAYGLCQVKYGIITINLFEVMLYVQGDIAALIRGITKVVVHELCHFYCPTITEEQCIVAEGLCQG